MKRMIQGLLLTGALVFGGGAVAQGTPQGQTARDPSAQAGRTVTQGGMVDHMGFMVPADEKGFLERLHHINQQEIKVGKLAQQNGQSPDVKSYGDMLVKDHTAADERVMAYAQKKGLKLSEPKAMNDVERKAMAAEKADMEKLQVLKGQAFDACFLAGMVGDHDMAIGKVMAAQQVLREPELNAMLQQTTQGMTRHRQQAYTLLGRIGPGAGSGVGGSGDMKEHKGHDMGTGGAGDPSKSGKGTDDRNTMDPGTQKKY